MVETLALKTFAQRLNWLCEKHPQVPPLNSGRQVTLAKKFKVSQEAARKWLADESMPRLKRIMDMAEYFSCRWEWLMSGLGDPYTEASPDAIREAAAPSYSAQRAQELGALLSKMDPGTQEQAMEYLRFLANAKTTR